MYPFIVHVKQIIFIRCMCTLPCFPAIFTKGDNFRDFLFAYLEDEIFQKRDLLLKEGTGPIGTNSFFYEMAPFYMAGNNENDRVASPESVSIHLNAV